MTGSKRIKKYVEGIEEGKSKKDAALDAGYAESTAKNPGHAIEELPTFQRLMKEYLPDDTLLEKHKELLNHKRPDINAKALDMAYKLGNKFQKDSVNINILSMSGVLDQLEIDDED